MQYFDIDKALVDLNKGYQVDFKPYLRTFTIVPESDGTLTIYDTDGAYSLGNSYDAVEEWFRTINFELINSFK